MANAQTLAERQQNMKMQVKSLPMPRDWAAPKP